MLESTTVGLAHAIWVDDTLLRGRFVMVGVSGTKKSKLKSKLIWMPNHNGGHDARWMNENFVKQDNHIPR